MYRIIQTNNGILIKGADYILKENETESGIISEKEITDFNNMTKTRELKKYDIIKVTPLAAANYYYVNANTVRLSTLDHYIDTYLIVKEDYTLQDISNRNSVKLHNCTLPNCMFEKVETPIHDGPNCLKLANVLKEYFSYPNHNEKDIWKYLSEFTVDGKIRYWENGKSIILKPGRFFTRFNNTPVIAEKFTNRCKSIFIKPEFKIVKGNDILAAYNEKNYLANSGQIGNSCMKYESMQGRLYFYTMCDNVSCLTAQIDGKIIGRAILWETDEFKFMDRIYTVNDHEVDLFLDWASKNGYKTKTNQTRHVDDTPKLTMELSFLNKHMDSFKEFNLYPHLTKLKDFYLKKDEILPYMDSFKYMYFRDNKYYLSTKPTSDHFVCFENSSTKCSVIEDNLIYSFQKNIDKIFKDELETREAEKRKKENIENYRAILADKLKGVTHIKHGIRGELFELKNITKNDIQLHNTTNRYYINYIGIFITGVVSFKNDTVALNCDILNNGQYLLNF